MAVVAYTVIWPVNFNGTQYAQGATANLDNTDPNVLALLGLANPPIALTSDPGTAAKLVTAQGLAAAGTQPAHPFRPETQRDSEADNPVTTTGSPTLSTHPTEGVDGDDALRYQ